MNNKKIVVLLKYYKGELNPFDGAALEAALRLGGEVTVLAMAPVGVLENMRSLTRLGVKAVLVSDKSYAGSDTIATSYILAEALKRLEFDWVFCGRQSMDGDTAQVPVMLAQRMGFDFVGKIMRIEGERFFTREGKEREVQNRSVCSFEKIHTLRFPSIFSKAGDVEIWDNGVLNLHLEKCGLKGSPTRVVKSSESKVGRRYCQPATLDDLPRLIEEGLRKQTVQKTETDETKEKVEVCAYVGKNVKAYAENVALTATELSVEGKSPEEIKEEILRRGFRSVLWEGTDEYKELASRTAVLLGAGLCADCIEFSAREGKLVMTRPACGGNVIADIVATSDVAMATVKTVQKSADVIFSVGRGGVEALDKIKLLAEKFNAELCCSRVVADSGTLPYEAQVGLTGRIVNPKVYVAIGISGAVQHTCGMEGSGTVIAVNRNKEERIFEYADYAIVTDVRDL